jgi:DNA excision repair protein ERCC-2
MISSSLRFHFAHETLRPGQRAFCDEVYDTIERRGSLFVNAPTGSGKTAAVLSPALTYALRRGLKVLFLTSRHTQHEIALQTARLLSSTEGFRSEFGRSVRVADIIGKRHLCALDLAVFGSDFIALCKGLRDADRCDFYRATKNDGKLTEQAKQVVSESNNLISQNASAIKVLSRERGVCPYEISAARAQGADLIIADYNHLFHPRIRHAFLKRLDADIGDIIVIADEAHNLPERLRGMIGARLSQYQLERAMSEAMAYRADDPDETISASLEKAKDLLTKFSTSFPDQDLVEKEAVLSILERSLIGYDDLDDFIGGLEALAQSVRAQEKPSYAGSIVEFLESWRADGELLRMVERDRFGFAFNVKTLDPRSVSAEIIASCHSFIAVSGTLQPLEMFSELLGAQSAKHLVVPSPFPEEHRFDLIVANATTKYAKRSAEMTRTYADTLSSILSSVPGNVIAFFPSYALLDEIVSALETTAGKKLLIERRSMSSDEKAGLLDLFRSSKERGALLCAVVGGSFGEGIDLPGEELRAVIVVGLPFEAPSLETTKLIDYYDRTFGKGWEYAYTYPAFNRIAQNAGRLIRTPQDRGAIIYLDERFSWNNYRRLLEREARTHLASGPWRSRLAAFYEEH